jgi:hypothetical protein
MISPETDGTQVLVEEFDDSCFDGRKRLLNIKFQVACIAAGPCFAEINTGFGRGV